MLVVGNGGAPRRGVVWIVAIIVLTAAASVDAQVVEQSAQKVEKTAPKKVVTAVRIDRNIAIDGQLTEPEWELAAPAGDFVQREPAEGAPATERTDVKVLYNDTFLYVGAICYDSDMSRLLISDLVEDHSTSQEDGFAILIDPFGDNATDVQFETNAAGSRSDSQHTGDGALNNRDWDTIWYVKTTRSGDRWIAEFAIPFKSLRFNSGENQRWSINFRRRVRRYNEETVWNPIPRTQNFGTPSRAGILAGLTDIAPGRSFYLKPFVLGAGNDFRDHQPDAVYDAGLDVKYGITNGLTLDVTYRTDFAQADVDQQQINLTRFGLTFPEKREFFLENAGIFSFGGQSSTAGTQLAFGQGAGNNLMRTPFGNNDFILFFSRRVGLSSDGAPVPVDIGTRLTGRLPHQFEIGLLHVRTAESGSVPAANYSVAKLRKLMLRNSDVGVMVVDREGGGTEFNRVVGLEQNFRFFANNLLVSSFVAKSATPGITSDDAAWGASAGWRDRKKAASIFHRTIQGQFENLSGFVRRRDIRQTKGNGSLYLRPGRRTGPLRSILEIAPQLDIDYIQNLAGEPVTRTWAPSVDVSFRNGAKLVGSYDHTLDRLERSFTPGPGASVSPGEYRLTESRVEYSADQSKPVTAQLWTSWGDFYGGRRTGSGGIVVFRPTYHLQTRLEYTRYSVSLPSAKFDTHLALLNVSAPFTPSLHLNTTLQYGTENRKLLSNIRFRYNYRPWRDLFVVYSETRDVFGIRQQDRSFTVKLTYALAL